jgi:osmotically-inducible protein OsmY
MQLMHCSKIRTVSLAILAVAAMLLTAACGRSDATIQSDAQTRLTSEPTLQGSKITTTVKDGVLVLTGETQTREQQERALQIARSVEGVDNVENQITVADDRLAKAVEAALKAEPLLASVPIRVEIHDGGVRLHSDQTSSEHRERAKAVARAVPGVNGVEDLMK